MRRFFFLTLLLLTTHAYGQTIIDDGTTHLLSGPSGPIAVRGNGTGLILVAPAAVTGSFTQPYSFLTLPVTAITASPGTTVSLSGGTVTGFSGGSLISDGGAAIATGGLFTATGGLVQGGSGGLYGSGGNALSLAGPAILAGGSFLGGDANGGQFAGRGLNFLGDALAITGGTFRAGSGGDNRIAALIWPGYGRGAGGLATISGGSFQAVSGEALDLYGARLMTADISGGQFSGGLSLDLWGGSSVTFFGHDLAYSSGLLTGTLADGSSLNNPLTAWGDIRVETRPDRITFIGQSFLPEPSSWVIGLTAAIALPVWWGITRWTRRKYGL